jgi:hypothetical protein
MKKENGMKVEIGSAVFDVVTGFKGVVTGRAEYITGCAQVLVQPKVKASGDHVEGRWLDETRVKVTAGPDRNLRMLPDTSDRGADIAAPVK